MEKTERGRASDEGMQRKRETTEEKERVKAENHKWMMRLIEDQNRQEVKKKTHNDLIIIIFVCTD